MDEKRLAAELLTLAEELESVRTADFGDVPVYFNVADFFERADGERMTSSDVKLALGILEEATLDLKGSFDDRVDTELRRNARRKIEDAGLTLR